MLLKPNFNTLFFFFCIDEQKICLFICKKIGDIYFYNMIFKTLLDQLVGERYIKYGCICTM